MLRYRPQILLCRWLSKDHFTAMVAGFAEFYMGALSSTRFLPGVGPFHLLFAIATVYGHPDEHKTKAARYVGFTRFARERGGSACKFAEKIITEVEEVEGTAVDSAFGRVENDGTRSKEDAVKRETVHGSRSLAKITEPSRCATYSRSLWHIDIILSVSWPACIGIR